MMHRATMGRRAQERRRRMFASIHDADDLGHAEKLYVLTVATLEAESDPRRGGRRRHGSKAMTTDGKYAFHNDYLADALDISVITLHRVRRSLMEKGVVTLVHRGSFGRPAEYQILIRTSRKGDHQCAPLR